MIINLNTDFKLNNTKDNIIHPAKRVSSIKSDGLCFKSKAPIMNDCFESQAKLITNAIKNEIDLFKLKKKKGDYFSSIFSDLFIKQDFLINKIQRNYSGYVEPKYSYDNGFDKYILGYKKEKEDLMISLIEPLLYNKGSLLGEIPSAVLISGSDGVTSGLVNTVVEKLKKDVNILYLGDNVPNSKLENILINLLHKTRTIYMLTGKRTLLICKNAEKFLNFQTSEANIIGRKLNKEDNKKLAELNKESSFVPYFKALLDVVAKDPNDKNASFMTSATTFLMTSENPHLIHPDLSEREGKINHIRTELPKGENLKDIIISAIKIQDDNFKDFLSDEDWEVVLKALNPNIIRGAYSAKYIDDIISRFYLKNNARNLGDFKKEILLIRYLLEQPRDISNKEYKKQNRISKVFDGVQEKKILGIEEIENLILQKNFGEISTEEESILEQKMIKAKTLIEKLNSKALRTKLSKREGKLKQELERLIELEK